MEKRFRPPVPLLIVAALLMAIGLVVNAQVANLPEETLRSNVLINAVPFLGIFISILLVYIALIITISRWLSGRVPVRVYRPLFTATVAGIVLGIVMMFQPWAMEIYRVGFMVLLISLLTFMVVSHITPQAAGPE